MRERRWAAWVVSLLLLGGASDAAAEVWVESAMIKVFKDSPATGATVAQLAAAQNEWEGFQIVVREATAVTVDDVSVSDLSGPGGAVIPGESAIVYAGWYHHVDNPSNCQGWEIPPCMDLPYYLRTEGDYVDALIPLQDPYGEDGAAVAVPLDVPPEESQPFFVDVHVPMEALPGVYSGTVTVSFSDGSTDEVQIELDVWDFDIPVVRNVKTSYGFSSGLIEKHHACPDDATCEAIVHNYIEALHDHRVDVTTLKGPIDFTFDAEGQLEPVDWSAYDAYMEPYLDGTAFADGAPVAAFNAGIFRPGHGLYGMEEAEYVQAAAAFLAHLEEKGWDDEMYLYSYDEPWLPQHEGAFEKIIASVELLMEADAAWDGHVLVTGPMMDEILGYVDIWCPVTPMYEDWGWATFPGRQEYATHLAEGGALWFYVCNANFPPYAGYDLDAPLGHEPRIVKWGAWYEGAEGFLFWRVNYWFSSDPWNEYSNYDQFGEAMGRNGDGVLLYPGNHDGTTETGSPPQVAIDGPVVTYRLKQIRDGLEDWELFILASDLGAEEFVEAEVAKAYTQFGTLLVEPYFDPEELPWTIDPEVMEEIRATVAAKVLHLLDPALYPDPEAPTTPDGPETVEMAEQPAALEMLETVEPLDYDGGATLDAGTAITPDVSSDGVADPPPDEEETVGGEEGGCSATPAAAPSLGICLLFVMSLLGLGLYRRQGAPWAQR